ncbi:MAG: alanine dehydrogenase [Fimbriimonas ginsengisoli]|uniref:Alanine dehydrogenase n=1 Tax=Fimbriimonas ginsengisoli TaxID=1005039 RepID=A0A931LXH6_FIMGI|nr:alanine dehydrogenase [Fimbriimonas ginsengisoli]
MTVGVPREVKDDEYRVALTPAGVMALREHGHEVVVETGAGAGTHIEDSDYADAGARIAAVESVWAQANLIVKVKEPRPVEFPRIRPGQLIFTYFHFAADEELMHAMVKSKAYCIAYETVEMPNGSLPLLTPMSEVAGRLSIQEGAKYLERPMGGRGVLLSGVPGTRPGVVGIIGAGVVGINALKVAAGFGATVYVLDVNLDRLRYLDDVFPNNVITLHSNPGTIREVLQECDLLIGAVYKTGTRAPVLVTREMLKLMKPGSVIVDVCVDQGGCIETTKATTHRNPVYEVDGVIHYAVANMPGAVAHTSTYALTNATLPYVLKLADHGLDALRADLPLRKGLNVADGKVTLEAIATQYGYAYMPAESLLAAGEASLA